MYRFDDVKVSAPSKVILFGEHAVVYGMTAVAASLDLRTRMEIKPHKSSILVNFPDIELFVSWKPEQLKGLFRNKPTDRVYDVHHSYLDQIHDFLKTESSNIRNASVICFLYVYSLIMDPVGIVPMEITVESEIPLGAGLGSSAALSVCLAAGLTGVLQQIQGLEKNIFTHSSSAVKKSVCQFAFLCEKILHGTPSGIDNSVSTYGGISSFSQGCLVPVVMKRRLRILLINTNLTRSTKELVSRVRDKHTKYPTIITPILEAINGISERFLAEVEHYNEFENDKKFYTVVEELIDCNQSLLCSLDVSHPALQDICQILKQSGLVGKLTGAGGGGFAFSVLPPSSPEKKISHVRDVLEAKGYTCYQADIGVDGYSIEKSS